MSDQIAPDLIATPGAPLVVEDYGTGARCQDAAGRLRELAGSTARYRTDRP